MQYKTTNDFPESQKGVLIHLSKFIDMTDLSLLHVLKKPVISYDCLLSLAAISPAILGEDMPRFYFRYWVNNVLLPLSNDLAIQRYWGHKLLVSEKKIKDLYLYWKKGAEIPRDALIAKTYRSIIVSIQKKEPEYPYELFLSGAYQFRVLMSSSDYAVPDNRSEDREEWLNAYLEALEKSDYEELAAQIRLRGSPQVRCAP